MFKLQTDRRQSESDKYFIDDLQIEQKFAFNFDFVISEFNVVRRENAREMA
jgi:hypothetical protein